MHLIRCLYLGIRSSFITILRSLFSSFGILFTITFLILYLSFRTSVQNFIDENFLSSLDINEISITPINEKLENVYTSSSGKGAKLKKDQVEAVRAMTEFERVYTLVVMDYRIRVRGEIFGKNNSMIVPLFAIETEFFEGKLKNWEKFKYRPGAPVPLVSPKFTLVMLNNYMYFTGLPQLSINDLLGFPLELQVETDRPVAPIPNMVTNDHPDEGFAHNELEAIVYGFTGALTRPGAIVPMEFVTYFAKKARNATIKQKSGYQYIQMYAKVKDAKTLPQTVEKLKKLGLQVESDEGIAKKANMVMKIVDSFSAAIVGMFLLLTVVSIFNSNLNIVYNNSHRFSLTRILGVSKLRIIVIFIAQAAAVGAIYGIVGFYGGNYLFKYAADYVSQFLPDIAGIKFVPSTDAKVLMMSIGISAGVSAASALIPAIFASNINLFKAVRK